MPSERVRRVGECALVAVLLATVAAAQQQQPPRRGRLPPNFPNGANPNLPADPLSGTPRPTQAPPLDLSGAWKGMFCSDILVELADLTLTASPDHRELTGELRFTPLPSPALRGVRLPPETVWTIKGRVDPGSNTVWLAPPPPGIPTGVRPSVDPKPMGAVYCAARNELAGQFRAPYQPAPPDPGATYFVFVRADAAARLKSLADHAVSAAPPAKGSGSGSPPSDAELAKWAAPYESEYGANAGSGGVEQISQRAMTILADGAFKPVFGEVYDRIDFAVLHAAIRRFAGADAKFAQTHGFMQYALWPSPTKLVSIEAMRTIDAWKDEILARFRSGTPVASAFDDLAATQKAIQESVVYAWPSTKKRTDEAIEELRGKLSGSSLGANVDTAIASATGLEGAKKLATWSKDNAAMLERLSPAERDAAQRQVDAKLDELLQSLVEPQVAQLARLGTGEPAVRAGTGWYKAFLEQFAFASARPPCAQAVAQLKTRRESDMSAGEAQLLQRIEASKTPEEVDALFANDLSVPGDDRTKPYAELAAAGAKRKQKIEEDRILALFSREEQEIMDRPGHLDLSRAKPRPPTPEEVRLATVRGWAAGNGKMIDARTARHVDMTSSKVIFFPFPVIVTFTQEHLIRADPVEKSADYDCTFTILMQMAAPDDNALINYDEVTRKQSVTMLQMVNTFCVGMSTEAQTRRLRLTEHGWVIPELMEAGAIEGALEDMLRRR